MVRMAPHGVRCANLDRRGAGWELLALQTPYLKAHRRSTARRAQDSSRRARGGMAPRDRGLPLARIRGPSVRSTSDLHLQTRSGGSRNQAPTLGSTSPDAPVGGEAVLYRTTAPMRLPGESSPPRTGLKK